MQKTKHEMDIFEYDKAIEVIVMLAQNAKTSYHNEEFDLTTDTILKIRKELLKMDDIVESGRSRKAGYMGL